ncbi:CAZyme family GH13, partial [Penicillium canariense]
AAKNLDQLPSWTAPDNTLIVQAFEWHVPADRHHWSRLKAALPDLKAIGADKIWIPPGCKGMDPSGNGYDIYDLYDLGEFDQKGSIATKWGTRKELEDLICHAQALSIDIIWDAVLNHKAGADFPERFEAVEVDPKRRDVEISKPLTIDGWVGFDFRARGNLYSSMKYHWQHFSGVDWDDKRKHQGIYKTHAPNKEWASDVSDENGNYDYLMFADLDLSHPEVRADLLHWGTWITNELSLNGMRLDAAKHFSTKFQKDFVDHVRRTANPDFFVIGEYWTGDVQAIMNYLEKLEHKVTAYDVPLVQKFSRLSHTRHADLRAYAIILLRKEGHPCVFYGDLYGIRANDAARPMTPACHGKLPILTRARKLYAYGEQEDYFDQPNCIGFVRYGNARHRSGLACVISNAGPAKKRMFIGRQNTNQRWIDVLGHHAADVLIDKWGCGLFPVNAMSVSVWVNSAAGGCGSLLEDTFNVNIYDY